MQESKFHHTSRIHSTKERVRKMVSTTVNGRLSNSNAIPPLEKVIIKPNAMRHVFNGLVHHNLSIFALSVGLIHVLLAFGYMVILPNSIAQKMSLVAIAVAATALIIWFGLRKWFVPIDWSHSLITVLTLLAALNTEMYIFLTGEIRQTILLFFIILAVAQIYLSIRWFLLTVTMILGSWLLVALRLPGSPVYFGGILMIGIVVAIVMFFVRRQSLIKYEGLRLKDEWRRRELFNRARQFETNLAVGQDIVSLLELDVLLNQVADLIKTQFDHDYVGVFLLNKEKKRLIIKAGTGEVGRRLCLEEISLPINEESLVGWVAVNCRHLRVSDVRLDSRYVEMKPETAVRSELDLPLSVNGELLGVLTLQSKKVNAFLKGDTPFLKLLSTQVANAIYNASLYQREKSARDLAETLQDTGEALTSTLKWDEVIDLILARLANIVNHDRATVFVRQEDELEMVAARGFAAEFDPLQIRILLQDENIFNKISETKRPLAIPDVHQRPDWQTSESLSDPRSWLGVPLIHFGQVTGMLSLARERLDPFSDDEVSLAVAFAAQAAIALENARLYEKITQFSQQMEYEVRQRTEAIQTAYKKLEHLNRTKSDFISIVSHELRTPVTVLSGYSQMLLQDPVVQENDALNHLSNGIQSGTERMQGIINTMLDVAKIDSQELKLHLSDVSLATLIRMAGEDFSQALQERHLTLTVENMDQIPVLYADAEALQKVFVHMITNAIKYTPDGGSIGISGTFLADSILDPSKPAVEVVISDSGIGIDPEKHELIFNKFYQTGDVLLHSSSKTMFKGGGPGLGLAVCQGIVEAHNGKLWVESLKHDEELCPGSVFHIVLPVMGKDDWQQAS